MARDELFPKKCDRLAPQRNGDDGVPVLPLPGAEKVANSLHRLSETEAADDRTSSLSEPGVRQNSHRFRSSPRSQGALQALREPVHHFLFERGFPAIRLIGSGLKGAGTGGSRRANDG
jgi:hypothetical protein